MVHKPMVKAAHKTDKLYMHVGRNLKHLREVQGLNIKTLAHNIGVTYQTLAGWERGAFMPTLPAFVVVCKYYNVTETDLLHKDLTKQDSI